MEERANTSVVEAILGLPLFQGITREQLQQLVEKFPFHFLKYSDDEPVIAAGDPCTHLKFVISGAVRVTARSRKLKVSIAHSLSAPDVVLPEHLFGMDTTYSCEVRAEGDCGIMQIAKAHYLGMLQLNQVLLFNALNRLSYGAQMQRTMLRSLTSCTVEQRLAMLVAVTTTRRSRHIVVDARQQDLCALAGATRQQLTAALERLTTISLVEREGDQRLLVNDRSALLEII